MDKIELEATPIPADEELELLEADQTALEDNDEPDVWASLFAALDRAIEAHKLTPVK